MGFSDCSETKRWMLGLADKCSTWKLIALCKGRPSDSIKKPLPTFLQVQNKFSNPLASIQWPEHRYQRDACLTVKICILPVCWKAIRFEQDLRCPGVMVSSGVAADTSCLDQYLHYRRMCLCSSAPWRCPVFSERSLRAAKPRSRHSILGEEYVCFCKLVPTELEEGTHPRICIV